MSRFNRTGSVHVRSLLDVSVRMALRNFHKLIWLYIAYAFLAGLCLCRKWLYVFVLWDSLGTLVATGISFAYVSSESGMSRLKCVLSRQGLTNFFIYMMRSFLYYQMAMSLMSRASTVTWKFTLLLAVNYATFFYSCFLFEGMTLSFALTCKFAFHLSFFAIPMSQSFTVFFLAMLLQALAPLTLGFTVWVTYMLRVCMFISICGSGTNIATVLY